MTISKFCGECEADFEPVVVAGGYIDAAGLNLCVFRSTAISVLDLQPISRLNCLKANPEKV